MASRPRPEIAGVVPVGDMAAPAEPVVPVAAPLAAVGVVLRRLAGIERLVALGNERYRACFSVIGALEIEGPFTRALLQRALLAVQRQHESLRVEIHNAPGQADQWVFRESALEVRLEVEERTGPEHWKDVWARLSHTQITGLPWRVIWVRSTESEVSHLVVAVHHAISDARSMALFFDAILRAVRRASENDHEVEPAVALVGPAHELVRARWPLWALLRIALHRYFGRLRTVPFDHRREVPLAERRWRGPFRTLEAEAVSRLRARCRQEGVTVGNALTAAMVLELAERVRSDEGERAEGFRVAVCTSFDLRPYTRPAIDPSVMGTLATAVHSFFRPSVTTRFWDLARAGHEKLEHQMARGEHRDMTMLHRLIGPLLAARTVRENFGRPLDGALLISNCGQVDDMEHPPFRANQLFLTGAQAAWGATLLLCTSTMRGRMSVHLGHPWPQISDETAAAYLDGVLARLDAAVGEASDQAARAAVVEQAEI